MPIKTNKISYDINYITLAQKFDFFKLSTTDDYFKGGAQMLDAPPVENNIQSVFFEHGKSFYVMMISSQNNRAQLKTLLQTADEGSKISFEKIEATALQSNILIQLLLNGIDNCSDDILKFNNLTGHLYCTHPNWFVSGKVASADAIIKIPCLEIRLPNDCELLLSVHTLTSEHLKKKITFRKKKFEDYPKYVLSDMNTIRRRLKNESATGYIMRQTDGKKTDIPFLSIQNKEQFDCSKMGVLCNIKRRFNKKYAGLCSIEFADVSETSFRNHKIKQDKIFSAAANGYLLSHKIHIVDSIGDKYSEIFCGEIVNLLKEHYNVKASIGKRLTKDALNIVLIHNAAYYIDGDDPHNKPHNGFVVQHITFEDYTKDSKFALKTVLNELLIKDDLAHGKIILFDWSALGIGNVSFGIREEIDGIDRFFFMDIVSDGTFHISEQKLDLFNMNEYSSCLRIFEDNEKIRGLIRDSQGKINAIADTDWFTIPEIDMINDELSSGNNKLRGKDARESLLSAVLDIHTFNLPNESGTYYFVGDIGEGMRPKVQCAANIRKVEQIEDAPDMLPMLLPLMDVTFVRNGQLTVLPFPFKYLREYTEKLCLQEK